MIQFCPYCSTLHKAIANQNYCSNMGDRISDVRTNAYYFKANKLNSGEHVSRLSIRTISDGYQYHRVNNKDLVLQKDNYLLVNEGEEFQSEITTERDVEGLLVAFDKADVASLSSSQKYSELQMLDDPNKVDDCEINLGTQSIRLSEELKFFLFQIKNGILTETQSTTYFEEIFMKILQVIFDDQSNIKKSIDRLEYKKTSTKREVFKRVRKSRDYIDGHFRESLSIKDLSNVAMMSTFNYVRNFKKLYKISPHQYLTSQRIKMAKFLLRDTEDNIGDICQQVGLVNSSSFSRLFRNLEGCTPQDYRSSQI